MVPEQAWPSRVFDWLAREPVAMGGAVLAWIAVARPSEAVMAACVASVTWVQRLASKSKRTAAEDVEAARYVGQVEAAAGGSAPPSV